jgi:serine phosphatase RsbU (regulator of sigma subunit)
MNKMENRKLLLIVDDDPRYVRLASLILEADYRILGATGGKHALEILQTEPLPDLILMDVKMPEMDGFELCRNLKASPRTRNIPVIYLTGQIEAKDETSGFEAGAVDYIHKPFSRSVMKSRVKTHIMLREAHDQLADQLATIAAELELARELQQSILPSEAPRMPGVTMAARYLPMTAVAGDFYDFIAIDERHVGVLMADVSGHGLPAALIASMLKVSLAAQAPHASDPARVLAGMNQSLCGKFKRHYVTAAYIFLDLEKGMVRYAGAGHPPLLLWSREEGQAKEFVENGLFIGPFVDTKYTSVEIHVGAGDRLLLYTDGILEFRNSAGEEFGGARVKEFLETSQQLDANQFADGLIRHLPEWAGQSAELPQLDDMTLIAIDIKSSN